MQLRPGRESDRPAALEVWRAALAAAGRRPRSHVVAATAALLAAPDALLVVADDGEGVPGFALGRWVPPAQGREPGLLRLELLVVHPSARRAGLGAALAEALADAGWPKGARRLVATPPDPTARAFLSACGLEPGDDDEMTGELEPPLREVVVRDDGLRLGQLLKLAGLVETGAEGKALLADGGVQVDGEVEVRRGRQLRDGEVVVARDRAVRVVLGGPPGASG